MSKTTTITVSKTNRRRLEAILRKNESYDFGISLLLLIFSKPKFPSGGILGMWRTVWPPFSEEEIADITKTLQEHATGEPLKRPREE